MSTVTIGLFGTCGNSNWRHTFIKRYDKLGIKYYNPQVSDWKPEYSKIEAEHLAKDEVILFPITSETYGEGSLSEVGFSILNAIKINNMRSFVVYIDDNLDEKLKENIEQYKASIRTRALVKQHLLQTKLSNVYIVNNLDDMLNISIKLYNIEKIRKSIEKYSLKEK